MKEVNASIITIGDELLIGQTVDTNSAYIATELNKLGIWVKRRIAVGDRKDEILNALAEQGKDCKVVIITGGLGPTADDITKPVLCEYFGSRLVVDEEALQNVKDIFTKLNKPLIERNLKQGEVPDNCRVLQNRRGTAPGMWFEKDGVIYVSLPGVPHEMRGLMQDGVLPGLKAALDLPVILHKTMLVAGKGESEIAEIISGFESNLPPSIKLAYLPAYGMVRLRLTGRSDDEEQLASGLEERFSELKKLVKEWMVADEDISLQEAVSRLLKKKNRTLSTAESCTGGYIAHLITSLPGSSAIYYGSVISYDNSVKENILKVSPDTLQQHGAVSEETVTQMAKGVLQALGTDYAIATSGIMGPGGGSPEKPVGTVWIAVASKQKVEARKFTFRFDRSRNTELSAHNALNLLRKFIIDVEGD
jgi:nicotinamide-nucleotide amidase